MGKIIENNTSKTRVAINRDEKNVLSLIAGHGQLGQKHIKMAVILSHHVLLALKVKLFYYQRSTTEDNQDLPMGLWLHF